MSSSSIESLLKQDHVQHFLQALGGPCPLLALNQATKFWGSRSPEHSDDAPLAAERYETARIEISRCEQAGICCRASATVLWPPPPSLADPRSPPESARFFAPAEPDFGFLQVIGGWFSVAQERLIAWAPKAVSLRLCLATPKTRESIQSPWSEREGFSEEELKALAGYVKDDAPAVIPNPVEWNRDNYVAANDSLTRAFTAPRLYAIDQELRHWFQTGRLRDFRITLDKIVPEKMHYPPHAMLFEDPPVQVYFATPRIVENLMTYHMMSAAQRPAGNSLMRFEFR